MSIFFKRRDKTPSTYNNIPPQEICGFIISVKDVNYKRRFSCGDACDTRTLMSRGVEKKCDYCITPKVRGSFICTEVIINILATSSIEEDWFCDNDEVHIIATNGNTYSGVILCVDVEDERHRANKYDYIPSRSKADVIYTFPELPESETIQTIIVNDYHKQNTIRFELIERASDEEDEYNLKNYQLKDIKKEESEVRDLEDDYPVANGLIFSSTLYQRNLLYSINQLKVLIFQRLNSRLSSNEIIKLEDKIETKIYAIGLDFGSRSAYDECRAIDDLYNDFQTTETEYREALMDRREQEGSREVRLLRVTELLNINPYDFEILCSRIMKELGYSKISVTPRSNDKGVDIIGEMNGERVVAQCKRYKNSVSSPDMQMFIGAMHNANATMGIYFTTATFTREAESMAKANNVILFGKEKLTNHLSLIDDYTGSNEFQSTLWEKE